MALRDLLIETSSDGEVEIVAKDLSEEGGKKVLYDCRLACGIFSARECARSVK